MRYLTMIILAAMCCQIHSQTLRELAGDKLLIGVAVSNLQINNPERNRKAVEIIANEFSSVVAENCMKPAYINPSEGVYNFEMADRFVDESIKRGQKVIGHTLCWHEQTNSWITRDSTGADVSPEVLRTRLHDYITTVVGHFRGRVHGWDVLNEAFLDNGHYRKTSYYRILGREFVPLIFQYAHEADPNAELYYNDYSMFNKAKSDSVAQMVRELKSRGIRIDAVGFQAHYDMNSPRLDDLERSISTIEQAGARINVTEFDLSPLPSPYTGANITKRFVRTPENDPYTQGLPTDIEERWTERTLQVIEVFLRHRENLNRITFWGLSDADSWRNGFPVPGRTDYPLLFNRKLEAKPIVERLKTILKGQRIPLI